MRQTIALACTLFAGGRTASGQAAENSTKLVIESWRWDDKEIWNDIIIPAFKVKHPDIEVEFSPDYPPEEHDTKQLARLEGGTAGDLIAVRPFDKSLDLFDKGFLADVTDMSVLDNFPDVAKTGWQTDDGSKTYAIPMASVITGFVYNKDLFDAVGVQVPTTQDALSDALETLKENGTYVPIAMGGTGWAGAEKGYMSIGPNYWKGEAGRKALIDGSQKLTENQWTDPWRQLLQWVPYTGEGSANRTTEEDLELFASGGAAMYLAGSWDLSQLSAVSFSIGAFLPPVPNDGDQCYIQDHIDMAMAMNAASPNAEAARTFLEWVGSEEFSQLYANALPGFFPLSNFDVEMDSPLQREFISWREKCESTIRPFAQFLDRGPDPTLTTQSFTAFADLINGQVSPDNVTSSMQTYLEGWYEPQVTERENNHTPADTESSDSSGASGMFHGFTVSLAVTSLQIFGILF